VLSASGWPEHIFPVCWSELGRIIFISSEFGLVTPGEMISLRHDKTAQLPSRGWFPD